MKIEYILSILSQLDSNLPVPEITKIVGESEDFYEITDYSVEWNSPTGLVDLSVFDSREKDYVLTIFADFRLQDGERFYDYFGVNDSSIEILKDLLGKMYS